MQVDFENELSLCNDFLKQDQRNFHCWNYRRHIHSQSGLPDMVEFEFSTNKIKENFSNYSAFHHRSIYLSECLLRQGKDVREVLQEELSIVENAVFTEPDDQSAWWYQQFLFVWAHKNSSKIAQDNANSNWLESITYKQIELIQGLLDLEPDSRWAMNSVVYLVDFLKRFPSFDLDPQKSYFMDIRRDFLNKLCVLDPMHVNRYQYLLLSKE